MTRVPDEIREKVKLRVEECVMKAHQMFKNKTFSIPDIFYDCHGTRGGYARGANELHFNPVLLQENLQDYLENTIPHEVAHCIDYATQDHWPGIRLDRSGRIRRAKRSVHGDSWKRIMRYFGCEPTRCHSYDTSNAAVKTKSKYEYKCNGCGHTLFVGPVRHRRLQAGAVYWHPACGRTRGTLSYVAAMGKVSWHQAREAAQRRAAVPKAVDKTNATIDSALAAHAAFSPYKSKLDHARALYNIYGSLRGRKFTIEQMVYQIGLKETTASSYYQGFKSRRL